VDLVLGKRDLEVAAGKREQDGHDAKGQPVSTSIIMLSFACSLTTPPCSTSQIGTADDTGERLQNATLPYYSEATVYP
jgi:hypothetical protein